MLASFAIAKHEYYVYDARMGSESQGNNLPNRHENHINTLGYFELKLDALYHPVAKESLMEATRRLLIGMLEYSYVESTTRTNILAQQYDIPGDFEMEHFPESLPEFLKLGLLDKLPEEYLIQFGQEQFDQWIGPFIRTVLRGHIEESQSLEHINECPERFCPAVITERMVNDRLRDQSRTIDQHIGYATFVDEMVYMNTRIVKELQSVGVYDEISANKLLTDYQGWLDSISDYQVTYDENIFREI